MEIGIFYSINILTFFNKISQKSKDYYKGPEQTAEITSLGVNSMMKAICNVQEAILMRPKVIIDKNDLRKINIVFDKQKQIYKTQKYHLTLLRFKK